MSGRKPSACMTEDNMRALVLGVVTLALSAGVGRVGPGAVPRLRLRTLWLRLRRVWLRPPRLRGKRLRSSRLCGTWHGWIDRYYHNARFGLHSTAGGVRLL